MEYVLFFILILVVQMGISHYYQNHVFDNVTVRRYFKKKGVFAGDEVEIVYEISNNKWMPLFNVRVVDELPQSLKVIKKNAVGTLNYFTVTVLWYKKVTRTYRFKALQRDYIQSESINLSVKDIFGLKESRTNFKTFDILHIYPMRKEIKVKRSLEIISDNNPIKKWLNEDPLNFHSLRKYASGDSLRKVNWIKTAQLNEMMVNEFEANQNKKVILFINMDMNESNSLGFYDEQLEVLLQNVTYLAEFLISNHYEVGLYMNCRYKPRNAGSWPSIYVKAESGAGRKQFYHICNNLTAADIRTVVKTERILRENKREFVQSKLLMLSLESPSVLRLVRMFQNNGIDIKGITVDIDKKIESA